MVKNQRELEIHTSTSMPKTTPPTTGSAQDGPLWERTNVTLGGEGTEEEGAHERMGEAAELGHVRLEAERPQTVEGDRQGEGESEQAREAVGVSPPSGKKPGW